jgi:hypothetical protein
LRIKGCPLHPADAASNSWPQYPQWRDVEPHANFTRPCFSGASPPKKNCTLPRRTISIPCSCLVDIAGDQPVESPSLCRASTLLAIAPPRDALMSGFVRPCASHSRRRRSASEGQKRASHLSCLRATDLGSTDSKLVLISFYRSSRNSVHEIFRCYYRTGGAYCSPPLFQSLFRPRSILSRDPEPTLRSKISP